MRVLLRRLVAFAALAACAASAVPARAQTAPTNVVATAIGVSSITWTWSDDGSATGGFIVFSSTNGNISGTLPPTASSYTWTFLSTNTQSGAYTQAIAGGTANSATVFAFTQAAQ